MSCRYFYILTPAIASVMLAAGAANSEDSNALYVEALNTDYQIIDTDARGGDSALVDQSADVPSHDDAATSDNSPTPAQSSGNQQAANHRHAHTISIVSMLVAFCALVGTAICIVHMRRMKLHHKLHISSLFADYIAAAKHSIRAKHHDDEDEESEFDDETEADYRPYENRSDEFDRKFLARLDVLIAENIANPQLNVDFLAAQMLVSRSLLFRRVKRITNRSVVEYINDKRIARAIELLQDGHYNLTEISELVGYSSLRYFSRVFKSATGELPSSYRQRIS